MNVGTVSLILPVHNEAENIESVLRSFHNEFEGRIDLQIIVAEDGSTDGTKDILTKLHKEIPMTLVMEKKRLGYMGGLKKGLAQAKSDYVLFCDADGQHSPSDFWQLYKAIGDCDMVDGYRRRRADSAFRRVMSHTFQALARILFGLDGLQDITAPYRLVRTNLAKTIARQVKYMRESFWTEFTIRAVNAGAIVKEVAVHHQPRQSGDTVVYKPNRIPQIAYSQFKAMLKIRLERG